MDLSVITEAQVARSVPPEIFQRGDEYRRRGAVTSATLRDDLLTAEVEGSAPEPYRVAIRFARNRIQSADCTCPYGDNFGGWCKHIVAVLLLAARSPERIDEAPPPDELLESVDEATLRAALLRLLEEDTTLADRLERALGAVAPAAVRPAGDGSRGLVIEPRRGSGGGR